MGHVSYRLALMLGRVGEPTVDRAFLVGSYGGGVRPILRGFNGA